MLQIHQDPPKVSVVIPVYNQENYVAETIESALSQTFQDFELLIIDDGSHDQSPQIIQEYAKRYPHKLIYLEHPNHANRGVSITRNLGIHRAQGAYIAFLDSDDLWVPEKLEQQVHILDTYPEVGFVYCAIATIDESGRPTNSIGDHYTLGGGVPDSVNNTFDMMFSITLPMWLGSTVLVKKELLFKAGLFDTGLAYQCEDAIMSIKLSSLSLTYFLSQPLVKYRLHSHNASRRWIVRNRVKQMNYHVMHRSYQWFQHASSDYHTHDFRIKLANLAYQAYQRHMISRWGLYKLLVRFFPYYSINWRMIKIFLTLGLGYTMATTIQHLLSLVRKTPR